MPAVCRPKKEICYKGDRVSDFSPPRPAPPKQTKKSDQLGCRARPAIGMATEAKSKIKSKPTGVKNLPNLKKPDLKSGCTAPSSLISNMRL